MHLLNQYSSMPRPAYASSEQALTFSKPTCTSTEPVLTSTEPACVVTESACALTEPACTWTEPTYASTEQTVKLREPASALFQSNWFLCLLFYRTFVPIASSGRNHWVLSHSTVPVLVTFTFAIFSNSIVAFSVFFILALISNMTVALSVTFTLAVLYNFIEVFLINLFGGSVKRSTCCFLLCPLPWWR